MSQTNLIFSQNECSFYRIIILLFCHTIRTNPFEKSATPLDSMTMLVLAKSSFGDNLEFSIFCALTSMLAHFLLLIFEEGNANEKDTIYFTHCNCIVIL